MPEIRPPAMDDFQQPPGTWYGPDWEVDPDGAAYTLRIPDGDGDWMPHAPSYEMAVRVLPELEWLKEKGIEYLGGKVDLDRAGYRGTVEIVDVHCDQRRQRITVEMEWESQLYGAWTVVFSWRDLSERNSCWPVGLSFRTR
ncbi:MAG TPA: hypothetical protein VHG91_08520 [Longimicrobium sp.]|nr:hypothetical protein [Longimicrobium sp.]